MTISDTLERLLATRISRPHSKYSKKDRADMEKKYQKKKKFHQAPRRPTTFEHISKYVNQKNINRVMDTMDSITRVIPPPKTNIEKEVRRRASKRIRYENQERKKILKEQRPKKDNTNYDFGYNMFGGKKKDSDFFRL